MKIKYNGGAALMITVIFMLAITLLVVEGFVSPLIREFQNSHKVVKSNAAYFLAESGIEDVFYRLKNGMDVSAVETISLNGATTTVTVTTISIYEKEVVSDANIDGYYRAVKATMSSSLTDLGFDYAAQVGKGGITLGENTEIRGAGGLDTDVYANGPIYGDNNAVVRGTLTVSSGQFDDMVASSTLCDTDQDMGRSPYVDVAQSFIPSDTEQLTKVSLYLKRNGLPGTKTVRLVADNAGVPDTVTLSQGSLNKNMAGTAYGWVDIPFTIPATVTNGIKYWIVVDGTSHASKYWHWCSDSTASYTDGSAAYTSNFNLGSWTGLSEDLTLKTYLGEGVSIIDNVEVTSHAKADTINNGFIWGDAYYASILGSTVMGTSYPGSPTPSAIPMPLTETMLTGWRADALAGGVISGGCPGSPACNSPIGPVKIDGDYSLNVIGTTTILSGIVHVTGDLDITNNNTLRCDPLYGSNSCIILVDGTIYPRNNSIFSGSGTPGSYVLAVSTVEGCTGGVQQAHCLSENSAIHLSNNLQSGLFYSTDSLIYLDNNAEVVSAIGYMLHIYNGGYITYEDQAANTTVNTGSDSGWHLNGWTEVE